MNTNTKTVKVVYYHSGENAGNRSPHCFLENFTGDLSEKCMRCLSFDDNRLIEVDMYAVAEHTLPVWMDERQFLNDEIKMRFATGFGFDILNSSANAWHNYKRIEAQTKQYFICWILKKYANTKNSFMRSLVDQVNEWLETPEPKYGFPLSQKQYDAATKFFPAWEAEKIATKIYWMR